MQLFSVLLKKNFPRSLTLLYCHNSFSISFIWTKWTSQSLTTARSKERRRSCTFKRNVPSAVSFQCMTRSTTNKKKKRNVAVWKKKWNSPHEGDGKNGYLLATSCVCHIYHLLQSRFLKKWLSERSELYFISRKCSAVMLHCQVMCTWTCVTCVTEQRRMLVSFHESK